LNTDHTDSVTQLYMSGMKKACQVANRPNLIGLTKFSHDNFIIVFKKN